MTDPQPMTDDGDHVHWFTEIGELEQIGWLWRSPSDMRWVFRRSLDGRMYPEGTIFRRVYGAKGMVR